MKMNQAERWLGAGLMGLGLLWGQAVLSGTGTGTVEAASQTNEVATGAARFVNAKVETKALDGSLSAAVKGWATAQKQAAWLGYAVETVEGERNVCCSNYNGDSGDHCGPCRLENGAMNIQTPNKETSKVQLEAPRMLAVMYRAEGGKLEKVKMFSLECEADAGGLNVTWLTGVKASESVSFLAGMVTSGGEREDPNKQALAALALHRSAAADTAMESFVAANQPEWLRKDTAFWLGEARGARGLKTLERMAKEDPSTQVREQVTFAISISKSPGAVDDLIGMAKNDRSPQVRGQAMFWLAQKAGNAAARTLTDAIENDPDTEVKKKAVFALSQMPKDEGVPKLIEVAQTNRNAEVRKQAMFWLGQTNDPRALAFFEEILAK